MPNDPTNDRKYHPEHCTVHIDHRHGCSCGADPLLEICKHCGHAKMAHVEYGGSCRQALAVPDGRECDCKCFASIPATSNPAKMTCEECEFQNADPETGVECIGPPCPPNTLTGSPPSPAPPDVATLMRRMKDAVDAEQASRRWEAFARHVVDDLRAHVQSRHIARVGEDPLVPLATCLADEFARVAGLTKFSAFMAASTAGATDQVLDAILQSKCEVRPVEPTRSPLRSVPA